MATSYFFALGAADIEMAAIERLLTALAARKLIAGFGYASAGGQRCHAGNAYQGTGILAPDGTETVVPADATLVEVECQLAIDLLTPMVVDHHRPGDPGYDRPAAESVAASSLGQLLSLLGREPEWQFAEELAKLLSELGWTEIGGSLDPLCEMVNTPAPGGWVFDDPYVGAEYVLGLGLDRRGEGAEPPFPPLATLAMVAPISWVAIMAADHNLAAAYGAKVPGLTAKDIFAARLPELMARNRATEEAVRDGIDAAAKALAAAPEIPIWGTRVRDLRGLGTLPYAVEAATMGGIAFVGRVDTRTPAKIFLSAPAEIVVAFLAFPPEGVTGTYGDPARGFAGGTQSAE